MYRVTKLDGKFIIISYGHPEIRVKIFNQCLNSLHYEVSFEKIPLSVISDFLNFVNSSDIKERNNFNQSNVTDILIESIILIT